SAKLLANWQYEVSADYGVTKALASTSGQLFKPHVADALGPSMIVNGVPICVRVPGDPATQITYTVHYPNGRLTTSPCVPLNLFAPAGSIPADQLANLTYQDGGTGSNTSQGVLATTSGRVAALPYHGDISMALGADVRDDAGTQSPPSVASSGDSTDNQAQV